MLRIQTDNLPAEQRQQLHPEFLANEQCYLRMRDELLGEFRGQWVAIVGNKVVASGKNLLLVLDQASMAGGHPFVAIVGMEDDVVFRARRVVFPYDQAYLPFPLPRLFATFWNHSKSRSVTIGDVIPDTGADISLLPDSDCRAIDLFSCPSVTGLAGGLTGVAMTALMYQAKVEIDGTEYAALVQPMTAGRERILGRDVMNQQRFLFDGPSLQVTVDP